MNISVFVVALPTVSTFPIQ